jgi:hypothetical protein
LSRVPFSTPSTLISGAHMSTPLVLAMYTVAAPVSRLPGSAARSALLMYCVGAATHPASTVARMGAIHDLLAVFAKPDPVAVQRAWMSLDLRLER